MKSLILSRDALTRLITDGRLKYVEPDPKIDRSLSLFNRRRWVEQCLRLGMNKPPEGVVAFTGSKWEEHTIPVPLWSHMPVKERWAISIGAKEVDAASWQDQGWTVWYEDGETRSFLTPEDAGKFPEGKIPWNITQQGEWRTPSTLPLWACRYSAQVQDIGVIRAQDVTDEHGYISNGALQQNWWCWVYSLALNQRND